MAYKIIDIQGVGPVYAEKLIAAGIETSEQLLAKASDAKGRKNLEAETGIRSDLILTWVNHADLFRVKGVGPQFAELLEAAGVDTVKELATRNAANLAVKLLEVNEAKHLAKRTPVEKEVVKFVEAAKALAPVVKY